MPKKRHQTRYSKPPSIAPPSLSISSSSATGSERHGRSVNELLADMRRASVNSDATQSNALPVLVPSLPPEIRQILQIPEAPVPRPRRLQRRDINGRRVPPGPPPPRSWLSLSQSRHAPSDASINMVIGRVQHLTLPGAYTPEDGSLVDGLLRRMAIDWPVQRDWNRFYLYTLPSRLRAALVYYVSRLYEPGISTADLRLILAGPPESELAKYGIERPDTSELNKDILHLDLTGSVGRGVTWKSLSDFLFPAAVFSMETDLQESWDAPGPAQGHTGLLTNLTHLSLAMSSTSAQVASWKQLLSLSSKLPKLTHLSLSGWPAPSTTPNALLAKVVSPHTGRSANYSGTNPYSHVLDGDWSEAISVLKRLSKALYSLEYLDLTSCGDWFPALHIEADGDLVMNSVDWAGDWGKIMTLRLCSGYAAESGSVSQLSRLWQWKRQAMTVEKHIRMQRAGRGRFITVETDILEEEDPMAGLLTDFAAARRQL
ncbi:hypothetical protein BJ170DRAFT_239914 [Xylariales sp. AK1849]|nr:hypothetical protein BJ170DRAFT_239914 [Xylariales sp. AK1849]